MEIRSMRQMTMKITIVIFIIASICIASCKAGSIDTEDKKPNIVIIFTDDHGYSNLSCLGVYDDVKTPNIDKLVESGVANKFFDYYIEGILDTGK